MICTTVKEGEECVFMTAEGCKYNGGSCKPVIEACSGCSKVKEYAVGQYCAASPEPAIRWKSGKCNLATHVKEAAGSNNKKINPIKASKKAAAKRK